MLPRWLAAPLIATACLVACNHGPPVQSATAPGFVAAGHGVSIVGVMKDGRLHPEAWSVIGPELSRPFGPGLCEAGFTERLRHEDPSLFLFADREAKENGVTEALLARFAEHAQGDLLLVFELWGEPPQRRPAEGAPVPMGTPGAPRYAGGSGVGARGMGPRGMSAPRGPDARVRRVGEEGSYGLAVSAYAPATKQWVAMAKLTDAGTASDEGVQKLAEELAKILPGARCAGWKHAAASSGSGSASVAASASVVGSASASASASASVAR